MSRDEIFDILAVIFAITCILVVLITLLYCIPNGKWAVNANGAGEMYIEVVIVGLAAPFTAWRLLRFMLIGMSQSRREEVRD
ncbi:MAG: hypothetical protein PHV74_15220 [Dehalococcoidia bacterium]|nr:hypothetical protein [Dehalococcoidia bacterium]